MPRAVLEGRVSSCPLWREEQFCKNYGHQHRIPEIIGLLKSRQNRYQSLTEVSPYQILTLEQYVSDGVFMTKLTPTATSGAFPDPQGLMVHMPIIFTQLPQGSVMDSVPQTHKDRDGVLSVLDVVIQALSLAKDGCAIPPAQIAFGSAGALLTMIRV